MTYNEIASVLKDLLEKVLSTEETFARGNHLLSREGKPLKPVASSLDRAARSCLGGGVIQSVYTLGIRKNVSSSSREYWAVMLTLADTLSLDGSKRERVRKIQHFSNTRPLEEIRQLVRTTIDRLEQP